MTGTGTLTVSVLDINDNYPIFADDNYAPVIQENVDPPLPIIEVSARDLDGPNNGPLFRFWQPCYGACPCASNPTCEQFAVKFIPRKSFYQIKGT